MTIQIYDGMAVLRRKFDNPGLGNKPRDVIVEMLTLPKTDIAVWCFEGSGSLAARRKIFPGYKVRPSTMDDSLHALVDLVREAMKHTRALQVSVPGYEADDVIAHLCQTHGVGGDNVVVHTVDRDLKALQTANVRIACGDITIKADAQDRTKDVVLPADQIRLYKTLCGDASDKIPGMPKFGPKAYLACQPALLNQAVGLLIAGLATPEHFIRAGVKEGMAARICDPAQAALLRSYWKIIGFMPLPDDWDRHVVPGVENAQAATQVLAPFMH